MISLSLQPRIFVVTTLLCHSLCVVAWGWSSVTTGGCSSVVRPRHYHASPPSYQGSRPRARGIGCISRRISWLTATSTSAKADVDVTMIDEDAPAGIEGAQFFGGNKQKEEFFDPIAEAEAGMDVAVDTVTVYNRFQDTAAFDQAAGLLAQELQSQFGAVISGDLTSSTLSGSSRGYKYAASASLKWDTPFKTTAASDPLAALKEAASFYKHVDVAITSGRTLSENTVQLNWEISVAWPTFWEPRILLTGTSRFETQKAQDTATTIIIQEQQDVLDDPDLLASIQRQIIPRFWDVYHIGMTPSAEVSPKFPSKSSSSSPPQVLPTFDYQLYELPARLYLQPCQLDSGDREEETANIIPNHAFSCVIKTMGPQKQRFVPTSPLEVQLVPTTQGRPLLQWKIPLSVEYASQAELVVPSVDNSNNNKNSNQDDENNGNTLQDAEIQASLSCSYQWVPRRKVATVSYGGGPQDVEISAIRKQLYDRVVVRDGHVPKLDAAGRPRFFFWTNSVKACFTTQGLGMAVYEWRPAYSKSNSVGIELEE